MKAPWMDPGLRELAALSALAALGCGLAAGQGDLLFVALFGAAISRRYDAYGATGKRRTPLAIHALSEFVPWDSIGASRVRPLDVSSVLAPDLCPGLSLILLCIAVLGQRGSQLGHSCP